MKEVLINQCSYCNKTSFYKSNLRKHEKKCFYNPVTRSCASCLWFGKKYSGELAECFSGELYSQGLGLRLIFKTECDKWIPYEIIGEIDVYENKGKIFNQISSGDLDVLDCIAEENQLEQKQPDK